MRFMMMIKADERFEAGGVPDPRLEDAMGRYIEESMRSGVLLSTGGLAPSRAATRLRASRGQLDRVDGPFAETKELIAGFAILQCRSDEEAVEHGMRFLRLHQEVLGADYVGVLEIRQIFGPE
jgi:hypothetical protein